MRGPQISLGGIKALGASISRIQARTGVAIVQQACVQLPVSQHVTAPARVEIVLQALALRVTVAGDVGQPGPQIPALGQGQLDPALHDSTAPGLRYAAKAVIGRQTQAAAEGEWRLRKLFCYGINSCLRIIFLSLSPIWY